MPVSFDYADESDPGPYPIPPDAPIEGGPGSDGDRHVIVIDNSTCTLYEMFYAHPQNGGQSWTAGSGAVFNLNSNALRPDYWTSADAAGLPIFPGLVRYSEVVEQGVIDHALRFTVAETRRAFIHPATHYASSNTNPDVPPMGLRFRMKAGYNCGGFSHEVQVICAALKKYGMFVADNGSDWYVSGAPDARWNDDALGDLKQITGDAFEVVATDGYAPPPPRLHPHHRPPPPPPAPVVIETPVPPPEPTTEIATSPSPSPATSPTPKHGRKTKATPTPTPLQAATGGTGCGWRRVSVRYRTRDPSRPWAHRRPRRRLLLVPKTIAPPRHFRAPRHRGIGLCADLPSCYCSLTTPRGGSNLSTAPRLAALIAAIALAGASAGGGHARARGLLHRKRHTRRRRCRPGDGVCADAGGACTLRAAIEETNALPGADAIVVPAGAYLLTVPEPVAGGIYVLIWM